MSQVVARAIVVLVWLLLAVGVGVVLGLPIYVWVADGIWQAALAVYGGLALGVAYWWASNRLGARP